MFRATAKNREPSLFSTLSILEEAEHRLQPLVTQRYRTSELFNIVLVI
jgi:hypothetical protein